MNNKFDKVMVMDIQRFSLNDGPGIRTTIFLKGCPLHCPWCSNPESQSPQETLMHFEDKCVKCGSCLQVCPLNAISFINGCLDFNRDVCNNCGKCCNQCLHDAIKISGVQMGIDEIVDIVKKDMAYYKVSGGGVTFSGGEPLAQSDGLRILAADLKRLGIHTAVETCGNVDNEIFINSIMNIDMIIIDFKSADGKMLREVTGGDKELISENISFAVKTGKDVLARIPVIPFINHDQFQMTGIFSELSGLGIKRADLLPYHIMGRKKYAQIGRKYPDYLGEKGLDKEQIETYRELGKKFGIITTISGK